MWYAENGFYFLNLVFIFQTMNLVIRYFKPAFQTLLPVIFSHVPAGSSLLQSEHFGQLIKSGHFRQFDHGFFGNLYNYRSTSPPEYNLKKVTAPVALYYSPNDWLAAVEDVQRLKNELPNVIKDYIVIKKVFNHMDFVWGMDANQEVCEEIIRTIEATDDVNNMLDYTDASKENLNESNYI